MMVIEKLSVDELEQYIRGQLGLILGPSMTVGAGSFREISRDLLIGSSDMTGDSDPFSVADRLIADNTDRTVIIDSVRASVERLQKHCNIGNLSSIRWSAVLSFSIDNAFETELQAWATKSPVRPNVTTIVDTALPVPPRSLPIFKMLGLAAREDFVITTNDYRLRKSCWPQILRDFPAYVRANAVLCCGFTECESMLLDLLALWISAPHPCPRPIILSENDPLIQSSNFHDLIRRGVHVITVECPIETIAQVIQCSAKTGYTQTLPFGSGSTTTFESLRTFSDLAIVVNTQTKTEIQASEQCLLNELLFSPTTPKWDAINHNLDFRRTVSHLLEKIIKEKVAAIGDAKIVQILVHGPAAVGKTTVIKRSALALATEGELVLWFRPYFYQDGSSEVKKLFSTISEGRLTNGRPMIVIVDDPLGLGTVSIVDIADAIRAKALAAIIVTVVRTTEVDSNDPAISLDNTDTVVDIMIPDTFDDEEWHTLPQYLVDLGVCGKLTEAQQRVNQAESRSARDVLAMLFMLLPETRSHITMSIRQELLRLGDRAAFTRVVVGELRETSNRLREAYELVAVAEKYGASVPIEVLVSTLDIPYDEWMSLSTDTELIWGLLYEESSSEGQTVVYRTRNDVVTSIVVDFVNGGALSCAGELTLLRKLLQACTGATPAYREFCLRVLVPRDKGRLSQLEYDEGARLFEEAIRALPFEDRTLLHHLGLWEKNKGNNPIRARTTLQRALRTADFPYSTKGEALEHIHTSLAATELDAIAKKLVPYDEGKRNVLNHIERARSDQFVNASAIHVQANMILKLADLTGTPDAPDTIQLVSTALTDVDRMLLLLKSDFAPSSPQRRKNVDMLETVRSDVINRCAPDKTQITDAEDIWEKYRRQDGFILRARIMYGRAIASNKGNHYKKTFDYITEVKTRIEESGTFVAIELYEVLLHTYFRWRVRRYALTEASAPIDWRLIEDIGNRMSSSLAVRNDYFFQYLVGLAKAHLKEWQDANVVFQALRSLGISNDVLWEDRDYLMNENGGMRRIQGIMRSGANKRFLDVEELGTDFLVNRNEQWGRDGEIEHAYVRFRFAGPMAVREP